MSHILEKSSIFDVLTTKERNGTDVEKCYDKKDFIKDFMNIYNDIEEREKDEQYNLSNFKYITKYIVISVAELLLLYKEIISLPQDKLIIVETSFVIDDIINIGDIDINKYKNKVISIDICEELYNISKDISLNLKYTTSPMKHQLQSLKRMIEMENYSKNIKNEKNKYSLGTKLKIFTHINALPPGSGKTLCFLLLIIETIIQEMKHSNVNNISNCSIETGEMHLPCNFILANEILLDNTWLKNIKKHISMSDLKIVQLFEEDFPENCYNLQLEKMIYGSINKSYDMDQFNVYLDKFYLKVKDAHIVLVSPKVFCNIFTLINCFKFKRLIVDEPHTIDTSGYIVRSSMFEIKYGIYNKPFGHIHICCATPYSIYKNCSNALNSFLVRGSIFLTNLPYYNDILRDNTVIYSKSYIDLIKNIPKDINIKYKYHCSKFENIIDIFDDQEIKTFIKNRDFARITKKFNIQTIGVMDIKEIYSLTINKELQKISILEKSIDNINIMIDNEKTNGYIVNSNKVGNNEIIEKVTDSLNLTRIIRRDIIENYNNEINNLNKQLSKANESYNNIKNRFDEQYNNFIEGNSECCICYENIKDKYYYVKNCSHITCVECSINWFLLMNKKSCPYCNTESSYVIVDNECKDIHKIYQSKLEILMDIAKLNYKKILIYKNQLDLDSSFSIETVFKNKDYEIYNFSNNEYNINKMYNSFTGSRKKSIIILDSVVHSSGLDFETVDCKIYHDGVSIVDEEQVNGRTDRIGRKFPCHKIILEQI